MVRVKLISVWHRNVSEFFACMTLSQRHLYHDRKLQVNNCKQKIKKNKKVDLVQNYETRAKKGRKSGDDMNI